MQHYGPDAVKQSEAAKVYILPLLTGHAAHKVTRLHEEGKDYNIPTILKILKTIISHQKFLDSSKALKRESRKTNKAGKKCMLVSSDSVKVAETHCCEENSSHCFTVGSGPASRNSSKKVSFENTHKSRLQNPSPDRREPVRYSTPTRSPSPEQFLCPFCETNDHSVKECKLYDSRDLYWEHILRKRWCSNCLKTGHQWRKCFKEQSCHLSCGRVDKHVTVLCDKYYN